VGAGDESLRGGRQLSEPRAIEGVRHLIVDDARLLRTPIARIPASYA
jgi:hypothetical protein